MVELDHAFEDDVHAVENLILVEEQGAFPVVDRHGHSPEFRESLLVGMRTDGDMPCDAVSAIASTTLSAANEAPINNHCSSIVAVGLLEIDLHQKVKGGQIEDNNSLL